MSITRRNVVLGAALPAAASFLPAPVWAAPKKVLRYAFEVAETSLDPVKISDLYSRTITPHIFESLYGYDPLARPSKIRPLTAAAMPEVSADFRTWTVRVRPGIFFADDPAFGGKRRELVAQDYVYSFKRFADPANLSPAWSSLEIDDFVGLNALHQAAVTGKKAFAYDTEIEGVRALDRYTVQFKVAKPRPRLLESTLASGDLFGAVAREVVEYYKDKVDEHPVGTGPFKLVQWRRSSFLAFERNPDYREVLYDAQPGADDAEGQAILARLKGRRLPLVDRVEISIIEEEQPRWLSFVNGEADLAYRVGYQFVGQAMPNGKVAPNLAKRGIQGFVVTDPATNFFYFNMEDPLVGGYTPEKVALRRAIGLGIDAQLIIDYAYMGLGNVARAPVLAHTSAYDPKVRSELTLYDPARANALLDLYGYRAGEDGVRRTPQGEPVVLRINSQAQQRDRKIAEVMNRNMKALGIGVQTIVAQWPENLKSGRAGKLQMWSLGLYASSADASGVYSMYDSREIGGQNYARFKNAEVDALYDQLQLLPDGPARAAAFDKIEKLALAYMPYRFTIERKSLDMAQRHVVGYRRPVFWLDFWQYVDIDTTAHPA